MIYYIIVTIRLWSYAVLQQMCSVVGTNSRPTSEFYDLPMLLQCYSMHRGSSLRLMVYVCGRFYTEKTSTRDLQHDTVVNSIRHCFIYCQLYTLLTHPHVSYNMIQSTLLAVVLFIAFIYCRLCTLLTLAEVIGHLTTRTSEQVSPGLNGRTLTGRTSRTA